ncbi:CoA transferase, partial [Pueribacillus theae]|uniref:CoA transferase n=1 Tax=Pueribacillus theae TaxID=2171751 RepID=UPI0023E8956C
QKGAFDVTVQAISGLMSVTGEENGPPVKSGVPVGDFVTALSRFMEHIVLSCISNCGQH